MTENSGVDVLWKDLTLLSDYQRKQINRLVSMRRKQDSHVDLIPLPIQQDQHIERVTPQWYLKALNSHSYNVRNGRIVHLVVVIQRYELRPGHLGFDVERESILPQNIAKLLPQLGDSNVQNRTSVPPSHTPTQDFKKVKKINAMLEADFFGMSEPLAPSGKPLDHSGDIGPSAYPDQDHFQISNIDEGSGMNTFVPLPPVIESDMDGVAERLDAHDIDNLLPLGKKKRKNKTRSRSRSRHYYETRPFYKEAGRYGDSSRRDSWIEASDDSGPADRIRGW